MSDPASSEASAQLRLRLYIAGETPNSATALSNLTAILEDHAHDLEIVDVLRSPERALEDSVFITPTLIRLHPPPQLRMVGALTDRSSVASKVFQAPD